MQSQPSRYIHGDWTPPSQLFHSRAVDHAPFPSQPTQGPPLSHNPNTYSQQQPQRLPNGYVPYANQERMMHTFQSTYKTQPLQPQSLPNGQRQQHTPQQQMDAASTHVSPQAPTPSPLSVSDGQTGHNIYNQGGMDHRPVSPSVRAQWGASATGNHPYQQAQQNQSQGYAYGNVYGLPHGHGHGHGHGHAHGQQ